MTGVPDGPTAGFSGRVVPAVDRAARMLALLQSEGRPMSITELARRLEASKGTVREILETLRAHGLLARDDETKLYRLGPQLVRLGESSRGSQDLVALARPHLNALCNAERESTLLLYPQGDRLVIQAAFEPSDPRTPIQISAQPGRSLPQTAGACGKVMMAFSDLVPAPDRKKHPKLAAEVERARSEGYAVSDGEFIEGVRGASAPILGSGGQLIALILISGVAESIGRDRLGEVGSAVRDTAHAVSLAAGGPGLAGATSTDG